MIASYCRNLGRIFQTVADYLRQSRMCLISIEFSFVGKLWDGWETMKSPIIQDFKGRAGNFPGGEGKLLWPLLSKLGSIYKRVAFLSVWATISQVFLANWRAAHDTSWKCSWFKNTLFFVLYCFFFNKRTLPLLWEGHNWNYFYYLPTALKKQLLIGCKHLITDFFFLHRSELHRQPFREPL